MNLPLTGEFNKVVAFSQVTKTTDGTGGNIEPYTAWFSTRGCLRIERQEQDFDSGLDQLVNKYKLFVFWRSEIEKDITKDTRVTIETRSFKCTGFSMVEEKRKMMMLKLTEVI